MQVVNLGPPLPCLKPCPQLKPRPRGGKRLHLPGARLEGLCETKEWSKRTSRPRPGGEASPRLPSPRRRAYQTLRPSNPTPGPKADLAPTVSSLKAGPRWARSPAPGDFLPGHCPLRD